MYEFIIASAGQVVEPTPQIEEPKQPEVKPEDPPVVQATEVPTEETIPEKDMQAEIDNDLNQKDIEEVKAESSSTLKKITETEAKTEKNRCKYSQNTGFLSSYFRIKNPWFPRGLMMKLITLELGLQK